MEQRVSYIIDAADLHKFLENIAAQITPGREGSTNAGREADGEPKLLTRKEVCEYLHCSLPAFHSFVKRGLITPIKLGSKTLVDAARLRADVEAGRLGRYRRTTPNR